MKKTIKLVFKNGTVLVLPYSYKPFQALYNGLKDPIIYEGASYIIDTSGLQAVIMEVEEEEPAAEGPAPAKKKK